MQYQLIDRGCVFYSPEKEEFLICQFKLSYFERGRIGEKSTPYFYIGDL